MADLPNVRLALSNRPENVALVRQALTGLAEGLGLDPADFDHINTAVAEACNNVVLHAYGGRPGPLEVAMHVSPLALRVVVRDRGSGIRPRMEASEPADGGIGLPMIRALSNSVELRDLGGEGTEVHMEFATPSALPIEPVADGEPLELADGAPPTDGSRSEHANTTVLAVAPTALARTVLPRVLCSLAARASFSTERIADTQLLADSLLEHLDGSAGAAQLGFEIGVAQDAVDLRMGPLNPGGAANLMADCAADGMRALIERLIDAQRAGHAGERELLALRLVDRS